MSRIFRLVQTIEAWILSTSIIAIALLTIANVFTRSVLKLITAGRVHFSLPFAEELSQFLIIGVTFVGLSYAASRGRHIRMTAVYDQLSAPWRKALMIGISSLTSLLMLTLAWYSLEYIATVRFLESVSPVLRVPLYVVYCLVPLGLGLAAIQYALTALRNVTSPEVYISFEEKDEYEQLLTGEV
jgi:TRAP-type C4-dicarboxylate transport system permease small subunit